MIDHAEDSSRDDRQEHRLQRLDVDLAWYEAGDGPTLVFLHGGPGLDHRSVLSLAELFRSTHRCVLYDQRGSGASSFPSDVALSAASLHINQHIADLEALREALGQERLSLVGWSWGAMLALLYGAAHPERVERLAVISTGPLTLELTEVYRANSIRPLDAANRLRHKELKARCEMAFAGGEHAVYREAYHALTELTIRVWFYDPDLARGFLPTYLAWIDDPFTMTMVQRQILASLGKFPHWDRIGAWQAPTLVLYGYQDFEPITQAFLLRDWIPQARLGFINECAHYPWLEQPERFSAIVHDWLALG